MAAYAALLSLEFRIKRHGDDPNYLPVPDNVYGMILDAMEQMKSTWEALEILDLDNYRYSSSRMKTWQLAESQLLNQFPFEFAIALSLFREVSPINRFKWFIISRNVDVWEIGRIRDAATACRLQHVLEALLSSLQLKPQQQQRRQPQILAELDTAKQQVHSFMQTAEKIIEDGNKSKNMVRLGDAFPQIAEDLIPEIEKHGDKMLIRIEDAVRRMNHGSRKRVSVVEVQIREAIYEIEDLMDTRLLNQFPVPFPMDLHEVQQYIPQFTQRLGNLKQEYINELVSMLPEESDDTISSRMSDDENKPKMVGSHDQFIKIKDVLFHSNLFHLEIIMIHGMGGIGKTVLAKQVFDDPSTMEIFELRVWVKVGQNFQLKRIKESILAQVMSRPYNYIEGGEERLDEYLDESLKGKRCLAVFDDVWDDNKFCDHMIRSLFPKDEKNGCPVKVILTTRRPSTYLFRVHEMRFMSNEESWELLCEKVFGKESLCPPLLKDAGKRIAENCEGLPLTIVTIGELLSKVERTPEKWNELADNPDSSLFEDAYDQMSKVLLPSYDFLSQRLKACFLYMGVFPRKYVMSVSGVLKLWNAEKLVQEVMSCTDVRCIGGELFENCLIMGRQKDLHFGYKTWSLNSAIWHLCRREALKNKFSYVLERFGDSLSGDMKNQRRLCVHKNILFGIKDVRKSMSSILTARSLLCTGPPHQYPVPIYLPLKLLRILNALTIRLYEFPLDVLKLFQLKYLALTCYGNLPSPISKLGTLEVLIIRKHRSIRSSRDVCYLPVEIWDMKQLMHLQVVGSDLPDPCEEEGALLPNLEKLLDVSAHSCNKRVFEATPNLTKLGIRIELNPNGRAPETLCCFDHIHRLKKLESLKCVVVNPTFGPHIVPPTLQIFPPSLEKLSLSGFGYPWEDMRFISSLPNLQCLKLRCYAFCGTNLEIKENEFPNLRFLVIEDADMVNLTVENGSLEEAFSIILKRCYKLESITYDGIGIIKLYDCYEFRKPNNNDPWSRCYINNSGLEGKE